MTDTVIAQLAALKVMSIAQLKARWRDLFASEPPLYSRRFLESRIAYKLQELHFGGLRPQTLERLEALGEALDGGDPATRRSRVDHDRPVAGTRLVREWRGVEHVVVVLADGYEWEGRRYRSLSAAARAIAGSRWNGRVFFGLKRQRGRP